MNYFLLIEIVFNELFCTFNHLQPIQDPDPVNRFDLIDSRDSSSSFLQENFYQFSSKQHAQYSTFCILYELHNKDVLKYHCDNCGRAVETRFHCTVCDVSILTVTHLILKYLRFGLCRFNRFFCFRRISIYVEPVMITSDMSTDWKRLAPILRFKYHRFRVGLHICSMLVFVKRNNALNRPVLRLKKSWITPRNAKNVKNAKSSSNSVAFMQNNVMKSSVRCRIVYSSKIESFINSASTVKDKTKQCFDTLHT